ncbi:MAG: hypothetical protein WA783_17285 [Phormidesmis sp.]
MTVVGAGAAIVMAALAVGSTQMRFGGKGKRTTDKKRESPEETTVDKAHIGQNENCIVKIALVQPPSRSASAQAIISLLYLALVIGAISVLTGRLEPVC